MTDRELEQDSRHVPEIALLVWENIDELCRSRGISENHIPAIRDLVIQRLDENSGEFWGIEEWKGQVQWRIEQRAKSKSDSE